jgi:hypothetical protein
MPNAFKRPADADKLDPQEQLKKLREALLRDAAARESDGENDPDDPADNAVNRKKEAAARRFTGVSGNAVGGKKPAASAPTSGGAMPQAAPKKNVVKGAAKSPAARKFAAVWRCWPNWHHWLDRRAKRRRQILRRLDRALNGLRLKGLRQRKRCRLLSRHRRRRLWKSRSRDGSSKKHPQALVCPRRGAPAQARASVRKSLRTKRLICSARVLSRGLRHAHRRRTPIRSARPRTRRRSMVRIKK